MVRLAAWARAATVPCRSLSLSLSPDDLMAQAQAQVQAPLATANPPDCQQPASQPAISPCWIAGHDSVAALDLFMMISRGQDSSTVRHVGTMCETGMFLQFC